MSENDKKKLEILIEELGKIRGRHTELVSVYIPAGFSLNKVINQIKQEQSTAINIKSKTVRKNVTSALERILQYLKLFKETPPNGMAVFSGNISDKEGVSDIELWSIEPHEPLNNKLYWCGQNFILDPLKTMVREREIYGIILLDKSEADVGLLKGKKVESVKHMESIVPGKTKKGGWCVHEDTILYTKNRKMRIKDLKNNDIVTVFDFQENGLTTGTCSKIMRRSPDKAFRISTANSLIDITPEHLVFISFDEKTKSAGDISIGDNVLVNENGNVTLSEVVKKIEIIPNGFYYDIEVPEYQNFIANDFIIHNSQARFARIRENLLNDFFKKVGEVASQTLMDTHDLKGVIISGPGPIKEDFYNGDFLDYRLKKKVIGVVNTSYTGEAGLNETVERSEDILSEASITREKKILDRFFGEFAKDSGLAIYGLREVVDALKSGNMELLLLSESFNKVEIAYRCSCGYEGRDIYSRENIPYTCPKCKGELEIVEEKDILTEVVQIAENMNTEIEMISTETRMGEQLKELGGIAGILRYRIE